MGRVWAVGVVLVGLLLVGMIYGCIWYAIPNRPVTRDWLIYGPLLLGPYVLAALGCGLSPGRLIRALATMTVSAGLLAAGIAVGDAWPTFGGGRPPDMPYSVVTAGVLVAGQYNAGGIAALCGLMDWLGSRAEPAAAPDRRGR